MSDRMMDDRRRALEEAFFTRHNDALLRQMRDAESQKSARGALAAASGIKDDAVLDRIEALGVGAETLAALTLAPLVLVAWADGSLSTEERAAVLKGAQQAGMEPGGVGHQLVEKWLHERPGAALGEAWKAYTAALTAGLDQGQRQQLRDALLARARAVAESAGGFLGLGIGERISAAERQVMHDLATTFEH